MRKLGFIVASALLVLGVASCKKNSDVQNPESKVDMVKTEFKAIQKNGGLRTSISGSDILWSTGDKIKIYAGVPTEGYDFYLNEGDGTTMATFDGWLPKTVTAPYYAVYPSSLSQGIDGDNIRYSIPAEQSYVENTFAANTVPMVAYSESEKSLAFKNQTAFIKLQLTGEGTIETMEIESASNNICGTFSVSKTDPATASTAVTGAKKIIVKNIRGTELNLSEAINVIIALAPADFAAKDLTLSMTTSDGATFKTKIGGFNISRSQCKVVEIENLTATTGVAETKFSHKVVKWVQLWANGPKWAEYNVGAEYNNIGFYFCWGMLINKDPERSYYYGLEDIQGGEHDTAKNWWGDNWQMPTAADFENLLSKCNVYWTDNYNGTGRAGRVFTGKEPRYANNSVFFPAIGYSVGMEVNGDGEYGYYWSSTPKRMSYEYANSLFFVPSEQFVGGVKRECGGSVRAVLREE